MKLGFMVAAAFAMYWENTDPIKPNKGAEIFTLQTDEKSFGTRGGAQLAIVDTYKRKASDLIDNIEAEAVAVAGTKES